MKYKYAGILISLNAILIVLVLFTVALIACGSSIDNHSVFVSEVNQDSNKINSYGLKLIAELNEKVKETSGLALLDDVLVTHNDKGKTNQLMMLDTENGKIVQTIDVNNALNKDWEDLAKNEEFIFIGDMGNNDGERKNLAIYLISISDINKNATSVKSKGSINFYYPEQTEFNNSKKHNFDCEAILCYNGQLFLFTKNRLDDRTNLYVLPAKPGNYAAKFIASFEVGARITGADVSPNRKKIALVGYNKNSDCFLWTFEEFSEKNFFTGKSHKYTLGPFAQVGQMEGIAFKDNSSVYISSEATQYISARLYFFKLN